MFKREPGLLWSGNSKETDKQARVNTGLKQAQHIFLTYSGLADYEIFVYETLLHEPGSAHH